MKTSVLMPSYGRPELFRRAHKSVTRNAVGELEILVGLEEGDVPYPVEGTVFKDIGSARKCHELAKKATGDVLLMLSDDEVVLTPGWDQKLHEAFPPDGLAVLYTRDDPQKHRGSVRPVITRRWYEVAGFYPDLFYHFYADTWVTKIAEAVGRLIYVDDVLIEHMHFKFWKSEFDATYKRRGSPDHETWVRTEKERQDIIKKVRAEIERSNSGVPETTGRAATG